MAVITVVGLLAWPGSATGTFPGSDGKIALDRGHQIYSIRPNGSQLDRLTHLQVAAAPKYSADGKRIVFMGERHQGHLQIFVMHANGTHLRQLTDSHTNRYPAFSPSGTKIAFESTRGGGSRVHVFIMRSDGAHIQRLHTGPRLLGGGTPEWSPTGGLIAYVREVSAGADNEIFLVHPNGSGVHELTSGFTTAVTPSFSPDGTAVAFTGGTGTAFEIWTIPTAGGSPQQVTFGPPGDFSEAPGFSPTGDRIAYTNFVNSNNTDLFTVPAGGGSQHDVTNSTAVEEDPDWQPR